MDKIRVLLVDDHPLVREGIRFVLSAAGDIDVVGEASDGDQALEMATALQPQVVLMDIAMPKLNGIEATRALKSRFPDLTVIILSMHDNEEYILPILRAGASGYVLKRTAAQELITALRAAVQGHTILHPDVAKRVMAKLDRPAPAAPAPSEDAAAALAPLTEREREILTLIARGLINQQIAEKLYISIKTVQAHRANIMEKLDMHDAVELTKFAIRTGLLRLDEG